MESNNDKIFVSSPDQEPQITSPVGVNRFSQFAFHSTQPSREKELKPAPRSPTKRPAPSPALSSSNATSTSSPKRRRRKQEISPSPGSKRVKIYDHLREIDDHLDTGLDIIFCGINPGEQSAQIGHHYGNPTNHFWSCLHESGLTSRRLDPREDHLLPKEFSMGLTNLVSRPTVGQIELSKAEQTSGVPLLLEKVARYQPLILCFVGLGIADIVRSGIRSESKSDFKGKAAFGLQSYKMVHPYDEANTHQQFRDSSDPHDARGTSETLFFAVSSTSGRVVRYQKADKIEQFKQLRAVLRDMKTGGLDTSKLTTVSAPPTSTPTPSASKDRLGMDNENPLVDR